MKQSKDANERVKRQYFNWLRKAKGMSEKTIEIVERALWEYGELTGHSDFRRFGSRVADQVSQKLVAQGKSEKARHKLFRHVRAFFEWLVSQPGFRSRIRPTDIDYLSLDRRETAIATSREPIDFPPFEYVVKLANSIKVQNELDMRDRAIISALFLSGMRDGALATLPIGCFDPKTRRIRQLPSHGVATKFSKPIVSILFQFDEQLVKYVLDWYHYLVGIKLFSSCAPLFPKTKMVHNQLSHQFESAGVEPVFWKGTQPIRKILLERSSSAGLPYFHPHTFRHSFIHFASRRCKTLEESMALAQIVGHSNLATTMCSYGRNEASRAIEILDGI